MFEIKLNAGGEVTMSGRFDAAQEAKASTFFDTIREPKSVDMRELEYISSLGLGILLRTQKRLKATGSGGLTLTHVNPHIFDILRFSGLNQIFEIHTDSGKS